MADARDDRPRKGGLARREKLSAEQRREIASRAAQARWARSSEGSSVLLSELGIYMSSDVLEAADMLVGELEAQSAAWRQAGADALAQGDLARARVTIDLIERTRQIEDRARTLKSEVDALLATVSRQSAADLLHKPVSLEGSFAAARTQERTDPSVMNAKRNQILKVLESKFGIQLRKRTAATFVDDDKNVRVVCTISKWYPRAEDYWYAFHTHQDVFLSDAARGFFVLGMMDLELAVVFPLNVIREFLPNLSTTAPVGGQTYWHLNVSRLLSGELKLHQARGETPVSLDQYVVKL